MRIHRTGAGVALALIVAALGGCSDNPSTGTMTVRLTDAPFPFDMIEAAELGVDGVEVHVSASDDGSQSGFWTVSETPEVLNLLELSNGVTTLVGTAELPVGTVNQMRLMVSSASVTLTDGRTFDLDVPSGESSGLKVFFDPPIMIADGEETNVLVDVDVSRSFRSIPSAPHQVDEITEFQFHPVLRVSVSDQVGRLAGRVTAAAGGSPIPNATVALWDDGAAVTATRTDADGEWMMLGVEPGTWIVRAEASGYVAQQTTATVSSGATTADVDFALEAGE